MYISWLTRHIPKKKRNGNSASGGIKHLPRLIVTLLFTVFSNSDFQDAFFVLFFFFLYKISHPYKRKQYKIIKKYFTRVDYNVLFLCVYFKSLHWAYYFRLIRRSNKTFVLYNPSLSKELFLSRIPLSPKQKKGGGKLR